MSARLLQGKLTITRSMSGRDDPRPITIAIEDALSGITVIEAHVALSAFAEAVTGFGERPCELEWHPAAAALIGRRREHKRLEVPIPPLPWSKQDEARRRVLIRAAIAPYEADGWRGRDSDAENGHNRVQGATGPRGESVMRISFDRWVDDDGTAVEED
jgi:hypothetical protein